ncbi:MAG: hypothetical protein JXR95_12555 [Deltaproteobacteria bacterium]|nr:hypothetical protein [Deltaproteobacteria bacterium]
MLSGKLDFLPNEFVDHLEKAISTNPDFSASLIDDRLEFRYRGNVVTLNSLYEKYLVHLEGGSLDHSKFLSLINRTTAA